MRISLMLTRREISRLLSSRIKSLSLTFNVGRAAADDDEYCCCWGDGDGDGVEAVDDDE